jgi:ribonucleoside-diphosphate reductase alpha chain
LAFADNVSPGIEPIFGCRVRHREHTDDRGMSALVADHAWRLFRARSGGLAPLPSAFVTAAGVSPVAQLRMLASITPFVDAGISKTIWVPADYPRSAFDRLARQAWLVGVKAFACYRSNPDIAPAMSADCESGADPFR